MFLIEHQAMLLHQKNILKLFRTSHRDAINQVMKKNLQGQ